MPRRERTKKMTEKDPGFEYINFKEKCFRVDETLSAKEGTAVCVIGCQKPHVHWREVSVQASVTPAPEIRSVARCIGHLHSCDPKKGNLCTAGLHVLGKELQQEFDALPRKDEWLYWCRSCRKAKNGSQTLRVDLLQQFKALSRGKVAVPVRRLGRKVKTRWKWTAIGHGQDARGNRR